MRRAVGHTSKLRRRRQRERQKSNRFNEQNNNSARASRFCTFPCSPFVSTIRREMTKFEVADRDQKGKIHRFCEACYVP